MSYVDIKRYSQVAIGWKENCSGGRRHTLISQVILTYAKGGGSEHRRISLYTDYIRHLFVDISLKSCRYRDNKKKCNLMVREELYHICKVYKGRIDSWCCGWYSKERVDQNPSTIANTYILRGLYQAQKNLQNYWYLIDCFMTFHSCLYWRWV